MALFYMVVALLWSHLVYGQYYYQPAEYFPQSYFTSPNFFYHPLTTSFQYSNPQTNNLENIENNVLPYEPNVKSSRNFEEATSDALRGFGYHNKFDDGDASSTVVFFSGSAQNIDLPKQRIAVTSVGPEEKNFNSFEEIFNKDDSRSAKSLNFEDIKTERHSFSPLVPIVRAFLDNPIPSGPVYYFYSVPQENETQDNKNLIEARASNEGDTSTVENQVESKKLDSKSNSTDKININEDVPKPDDKKAKFVIEYKSSTLTTDKVGSNSTTSTTTTELNTDSTTDLETTTPDSA